MRDCVKIISLFGKDRYSKKFPGLPLIFEEDFFLECFCHDVCIPIATAQPDSLNIFEETVLKLLGIFGKSVEEISRLSCLEKDFVQSICLSLRQRNFINENNVLSEDAKDYLNNTSLSDSAEEKAIQLLRLPGTGTLLAPVIQDFKSEYEGFFDGKKLVMMIGPQDVGDSESRRGSFKTVPKDQKFFSRPIYVHDVKKIIREYNRTTRRPIRLADGYAMSISQKGSRVFIHLKSAIQRGLVEHPIISDGTSMISGALVQYVTENYRDYVDALFERATTFNADTSDKSRTFSEKQYYHVRHNLDELEDFLTGTDPDSLNINLEREKNNFNRLNAAVEHALNYYLVKYPVSETRKKILYNQTQIENCRTLTTFANRLNLAVDEDEALFSKINRLSFERYNQSGVPSLEFVLSLAIVSGVENSSGPFADAVRKMPNLFELFKILYRTKIFRHGSEQNKSLSADYSKVADDVKKIISILLPDYRQDDNQEKNLSRVDDVSQEKINAVVELKKVLGNKIYYEAGDNLRKELIRISPYYSGDKMLAPMEFVNCLYVCLENYIRDKANNFSARTKNLSTVLSELKALTGFDLPKSLRSVSQKMFIAATAGKDASLGAYILVIMNALPNELLTDKKRVKKFLDDTGEIVKLRQHANNTELNLILTAKKLSLLRENVFDAIKFLEEF